MLLLIDRLKKQAVTLRLRGEARERQRALSRLPKPTFSGSPLVTCKRCGVPNLMWKKTKKGKWALYEGRNFAFPHCRTCAPDA